MFNVKKLLATVSVAAILSSSFLINASAAAYHFRGDVNNDAYVDNKDGNALTDFILGKKVSGITRQSSDLNNDGSVDIFDLVILRRILAGYDKQTLFIRGGNKEFKPGERFLENDKYYAVFQGDGNCVVYKKSGGHVFHTGTHFGDDFKDYRLIFQADGNIVIYATPNYPGSARRAIWHSRTHDRNKDTTKPYELSFDSNGNLLFNGQNGLMWKSTTKYNPDPLTNAERRMVAKERIYSGYLYPSHEKAAVDFIFYFNPISVAAQREYGTSIDRVYDSNGKEKYKIDMDCQLIGPYRDRNTVAGDGPEIGFGGDTVAYVHTHAHYVGWQNNYFSIYPNKAGEETDISLTYKYNCVAYLGAPNGDIRVFDPNKDPWTGNQTTTGRVIMRNAPH